MKVHPLALEYLSGSDKSVKELKDYYKENDLMQPIITFKGEILEGINRYVACKELGIEPDYEEYRGKDPETLLLFLAEFYSEFGADELVRYGWSGVMPIVFQIAEERNPSKPKDKQNSK